MLISPGLSSSLHGSATTFGQTKGTGFGSAFQSPGITAHHHTASGYNTSRLSPTASSGVGADALAPGTPLTARGDRRSKLVRERSRSSAAFAASSSSSHPPSVPLLRSATAATSSSAATEKITNIAEEDEESEERSNRLPALFTSLCYRGMEVIFTVVNGGNDNRQDGERQRQLSSCYLLGIHARSRVPFQKCFISTNFPTDNTKSIAGKPIAGKLSNNHKVEIVQLTSHPNSGYIFVADNFGNIHSFRPVQSDPMMEAYGKFRWANGNVATTREVFGYPPLLHGGTATAPSGGNCDGKGGRLWNTVRVDDSS